MVKCSKCRYGIKKWDTFFDEIYFECTIDGDWIGEDVAENDELGCELYADLCNDDAKKGDQ